MGSQTGAVVGLDSLPDLLGDRTVACAESCTAGRVAAELAGVGNAAEWLVGGLVAYQTSVKRRLLGVASESVVTGQAAGEMAEGAASLFGSDVAVATTGVLGDEPVDGVAPGTVYVATLVDARVRICEHRVSGTPEQRCAEAVEAACRQIVVHLTAMGGTGVRLGSEAQWR